MSLPNETSISEFSFRLDFCEAHLCLTPVYTDEKEEDSLLICFENQRLKYWHLPIIGTQ